jgi:hypothetical protein
VLKVILLSTQAAWSSDPNLNRWPEVGSNVGRASLNVQYLSVTVGDMKTEASDKPVPMDGALAAALFDWSKQALYRQPGDWVFASPKMKGKQPYWPETPLKCFVQPAAKRLGITK